MADLPEPIDYRQLPVSHSKQHTSFREPKCNNPMIAAVIPGFRNRQQVEDILWGAEKPLNAEELSYIQKIFRP